MPTSTRHWGRPTAARSWTFEWPSQTPLIVAICVIVFAAGLFGYCLWPREDVKAALDRQIEEGWMAQGKTVDALEFFEKGGVYENRISENAKDAKDIDQKYVIPLIKKLRDKHHLKVLAIMHKDIPNTAMAVIAEAPKDRAIRNEVRATILETADEFLPGFAWQNWSHHWVSLDFFDSEEIIPFKSSGALEKLQTSQRIME